jgi:hypothetical protein
VKRTAIALLAVTSIAALLGVFAHALYAQPSRDADAELAIAVAKVAANEASLSAIRPAEVALVFQCAEARASTSSSRLAWLTRHSSCVLTDRAMTDAEARGNCPWARALEDSDDEPDGFPEQLSWPRHARRWAQVRELARRLVDGRERFRPCAGEPFTWGSRDLDMAQAIERGLVPLDCRDEQGEPTLNEGFALAGSRGAS